MTTTSQSGQRADAVAGWLLAGGAAVQTPRSRLALRGWSGAIALRRRDGHRWATDRTGPRFRRDGH